MKSEAFDHPKRDRLEDLVGCGLRAVGIMESLWKITARMAPHGDIGKHTNRRIAHEMRCTFCEPDELIDCLVSAGFLDRSDEHRLVVHDWHDHCENWVKSKVQRGQQKGGPGFASLGTDSLESGPGGTSESCSEPEFSAGLKSATETASSAEQSCGTEVGFSALHQCGTPKPKPKPEPKPDAKGQGPSPAPLDFSASPERIDELLDLYPKVVARPKSRQALRLRIAQVARERPEGMREGEGPVEYLERRIRAFSASPAGSEKRYVPNPANWFADHRDEDPDESWQTGDAPRSTPQTRGRYAS